mgnify:CR=1 FL=1
MENIKSKKSIENEFAFLSKKILELNKRLVESEKAKSRFLSLVQNKLNNPMTVLLGIVPHLKIIEDEKNRMYLELVHKEVLNLDFIIQNLEAAAKIESGDIDVSYALVNIKEIADEVVENLRYVIKEKNIKVDIIDKIGKNIVTDPKKAYLILRNLFSNACRYAKEGSTISIDIDREDIMLIISVKNEGEAPNVEHVPELFTRFADEVGGDHGLGIGLSIVRELCERLNGSVYFTSEEGYVSFIVKLFIEENIKDSDTYDSGEFLFKSSDDVIEL